MNEAPLHLHEIGTEFYATLAVLALFAAVVLVEIVRERRASKD